MCMSVFGTSDDIAMRLSYDGEGFPLNMMYYICHWTTFTTNLTRPPTLHPLCSLEDNGVITDCTIKTLERDDVQEMDIAVANIPSNIIMKA